MHVKYCEEFIKEISTSDLYLGSLIRSIHDIHSREKKFPVLNGVALYQETALNTRQLKIVIDELEKFQQTHNNEEAQKIAHDLVGYIRSIDLDDTDNMDKFLVFVGD